jgi:hypothetical protein
VVTEGGELDCGELKVVNSDPRRGSIVKRISLLCVVSGLVATGCLDNDRKHTPRAPDAAGPLDSAIILARIPISVDSVCASTPSRDERSICRNRIGPMTRTTTRAALDTLFASVRDDSILIEGGAYPSSVVNSGRADSIVIMWSDSTRTLITGFAALGAGWKTPDGLTAGSPMEDLLNVLGPKLRMLGFGWDYGGTIMLAGTRLEDSGIFFRMEPTATDSAARAARERVRGDRPFDPASADVRALKPRVRTIDILWK